MGFAVAVSIQACCALRANSSETLPRALIRDRASIVTNLRNSGRVRKQDGIQRNVRVNASAKGRDGWSQIPLDDICRRLHLCFFEVIDPLLED